MFNIPVIISAALSLIGQTIIVALFISYRQLRHGLIPRIILYLTAGGIIQTLGILCSSFSDFNCTLFGIFRLYGGLSSLFWSAILIYSIKQMFTVFSNNDSEFKDIRDILDQLLSMENRFCLYSFGLPFILILYPLITAILFDDKHQELCLFYSLQTDPLVQKLSLNLQKLILWIIPISLYLCYSLSILNRIKRLLKEDEEKKELYVEVKKMIKQILLFPLITLICTISFTVEDIQTLFISNVGETQTTVSLVFLSFWGFLNCLAYLSQESVKLQIRSRGMSDEQDW